MTVDLMGVLHSALDTAVATLPPELQQSARDEVLDRADQFIGIAEMAAVGTLEQDIAACIADIGVTVVLFD